jgi:hypothetical protein
VRFTIDIGDAEKHQIEYIFNQLAGQLEVKINGQSVRKSRRLFNEPVLETHVFEVGTNERYHVRIEKERKPLLGHRNRVFVNNRLLKVVESK